MKSKIQIITLLLTAFAFGCIQRHSESHALRDLDFKEAQLVEYNMLFNPQNAILIQLETSEESLISNNYYMRLYDKDLFVFDYHQGQVVRFNIEGKFLNTIGMKGKGPGELFNPTDFCVDSKNQTVEILCEPGSTIKKFSFQGDFISKVSFEFPSQSFIKDSRGCYYFYRGVNSGYSNYRLTYTDSSSIINELLLDPGNAPVGLVMDHKCFVKNKGNVFLKEVLLNQILYLEEGQLVEGIKIHFSENEVTIDNYRTFSNMMAFFLHLDNNGFYTIKNYDILGNHAFMKVQYQKADEELLSHFLYVDLLMNAIQYVSGKHYSDLFNILEFQLLLPDDRFLFTIDAHSFQLLEPFIPKSTFESLNINQDDNPILIFF